LSVSKSVSWGRLERWWIKVLLVVLKTGSAALIALRQAPSILVRPATCRL